MAGDPRLQKGGKKLSLRGKLILLILGLFILSLLVTGFVVRTTVVHQFEGRMAENTMNIAIAVATIPDIVQNVGKIDGSSVIQPLADTIRKETGAEFIVVVDMDGIRYSHKVPDRIGQKVVGGDEGPALQGRSYISRAVGTLGPSLRAFVPIYRGDYQVGAVLVGTLIDNVKREIWSITLNILLALMLGLIVGVIGATSLADEVKSSMRGLEPDEIDRLLWEKEAMLESIREGIVAVDGEGKITLVNNQARRLLGLPDSGVVGKPVEKTIPSSRLPEVLRSGTPEYDREQILGSVRIMTNRVPIVFKEKAVGAVASFRDMSEITAMAEELTSVNRYVDALRVGNHEFMNKLQTISGLIQLGETEKALSFISKTVQFTHSTMSFITSRIKNPSVAGLLLGKMGRCRELGIELHIDPDSYLGPQGRVDANSLVLILGNLLENSMNALMEVPVQRRSLELALFDESSRIIISVKDRGPGIPENLKETIFEKGFSTKKGANRGIGLNSVKTVVETYGGEISLESMEGEYTEFLINLPNGGGNL